MVITAVGGQKIRNVGKVGLNLNHNGKTFKAVFLIIDSETDTLIGLKSSMEMDLVHLNDINNDCTINQVKINKEFWFDTYAELFKGLVCLKDACHLTTLNPLWIRLEEYLLI